MCLGVVGVRERDRKLLPEIQAMNNEDQGWRLGAGWDEDRMPRTW